MKSQRITQVLNLLNPTYVEEAGTFSFPVKRRRRIIWYISAAACLLLLLSSTLWIVIRSLSPSEPDGWDILLEHSKPTFTEGVDGASDPTVPSTAPIEPSSQTTTPPLSENPTNSESTEDPTSPDPTDHTEPTEPPPTIGNTDPTGEPFIPPAPNGASDPEYLDFLTNEPICLMELPKLPAAGGEEFILKQLSFCELYSLEAAEAGTYPIFADPYPVGPDGPLFQITEDYLAVARSNLQRFLTLLLGEGDYSGIYKPDVSHRLLYEAKGISLTAGHSSVNVMSKLYALSSPLTQEDLSSNALIRSALSYCAIEAPVIIEEIEYDIYGNVYAYIYTLTEETADPLTAVVKDRFSYVKIRAYKDGGENLLSVTAVHSQTPVEAGVTTLATVEDIEVYLQEAYPHLYENNHVIELYYSSGVIPGYTVPCYLVIFVNPEMTEKYGVPAYTVVQLTDSRFLS